MYFFVDTPYNLCIIKYAASLARLNLKCSYANQRQLFYIQLNYEKEVNHHANRS